MTYIVQHFPKVSNIADGFRTTFLLLSLKWRMLRDLKSKSFIWIGATIFVIAIILASNAGYIIKTVAESSRESAAQTFAMTYLQSFARGEVGVAGSIVLGLSILSALIAPFTGATNTVIVSPKSLIAIPVSKWHRYTDSLIGHFFSSISILQLMALSAITSMLTLQEGRTLGTLFTWTVWGLLCLLAATVTWVSEIFSRRFSFAMRMGIMAGFAIFATSLALIAFDELPTLFGLGEKYAYLVQHLGGMSTSEVVTVFSTLGIIGLILIWFGMFFASIALSLPENGKGTKEKNLTYSKSLLSKVSKFGSKHPVLQFFKILSLTILRSKETRKPIIAILLTGLLIAFFTGNNSGVISTSIVMLPIVIALSWAANTFGVIGGGMTLLASQPRLISRMPWMIFTIQIIYTLILFVIIWAIPTFFGIISIDTLLSVLLAGIATTAIISRSSVTKSINKPHSVHFGQQNEMLLPPMTLLGYTFRFALWGGQYGIIVFFIDDLPTKISLAFLAVIWSMLRMVLIQEKWQKPETKAHVMRTVLQD